MININKTVIIKSKNINNLKIEDAILVVGLPGFGGIGAIITELLINQFKAIKIATLYSNQFPPNVLMLENGEIKFLDNSFYFIKLPNKKNNLIILTGDTQPITPEGQYETNSKIIDFFKKEFKGNFILTIGGYMQQDSEVKIPKVFGNVTNKKLIERFKNYGIIFNHSKGPIYGSLGLLMAFAQSSKIDGLCLMGEVQNIEIDPNAVKSVIVILNKLLNINIDTKEVDNLIKSIDKANAQVLQGLNTSPPRNDDENLQPSYIR